MNRNEILDEVANSKIYDEIIAKYFQNDEESAQEFKQFLFLQLCEIAPEKIEAVHEKKQLIYFIVGIINRQIKSSDSRYHKIYRKYSALGVPVEDDLLEYGPEDGSVSEFEIQDEENYKALKLKQIYAAIEYHLNRDPFLFTEFQLFKLHYVNNLSYREIEEQIGIPLTSCHKYVQTAKQLIRGFIINKKYKKQI